MDDMIDTVLMALKQAGVRATEGLGHWPIEIEANDGTIYGLSLEDAEEDNG